MCGFRKNGRLLSLAVALSAAILCISGIPLKAIESSAKLESGPYKAGFRTIERYDYSRTFGAKYDYFGKLIPGETARPIQICIWYPAANTAGGPEMVYAEYLFPYPEDQRFFDFLSNVQNRELRTLLTLLRGDQGSMLDLNNSPMGAIRDAALVEGRFPLIIYEPDLGHGIAENAPLMEYLASHGFIVITTHSIGPGSLAVNREQDDLETLIRDKEFALSLMREDPSVDTDKIGAMGFGYGAFASLVLAMRNGNIGALAGLDGAFMFAENFEFALQQANFNPLALKRPMMQLCRTGSDQIDRALFDSLKYCPRYLCSFGGTERLCFNYYDMIVESADTSSAGRSADTPDYTTAFVHVRQFFDGYLNGDAESMAALAKSVEKPEYGPELLTLKFSEGTDAPPNADQFLEIIGEHGVDKAVELNNTFGLFSPESPLLSEGVIANLGYQHLRQGQIPAAIELFRMYTQGYPNSANSWDCFAEAHLNAGDNQAAIKYYSKALEVVETDTTTPAQFKEQIRQGATAALERLEQPGDEN